MADDKANPVVTAKIQQAIFAERVKRIAREQVDRERPAPELSIRQASDVKDEKLNTLFGGRLVRGAFQLLVGPGEAGKGMLSVDVIARLSTGAPFPGEGKEWRQATAVVICVTEDSSARVKARLIAAEANLRNIWFVEGPPAMRGGLIVPSPIAFDSDAGALLKLIQVKQATALFLETTVEHLGDREKRKQWSTNNEMEVRNALAPLIAVCREGGIMGWGVMHPRKSVEGGIEDSISGSLAFRNVGRGVMNVYRDPSDRDNKSPWRLLITSKSNYLPERPPTLRFRIESWERDKNEGRVVWGIENRTLEDDRDAEQIWQDIRESQKVRKDFTVRDAEILLKKFLANGEVKTIEEIQSKAEEADLSWRAVQRAKENLGLESVKAGFPAQVIGWRLRRKETEM